MTGIPPVKNNVDFDKKNVREMVVFTADIARTLLESIQNGISEVEISTDLGLSRRTVDVDGIGCYLKYDGQKLLIPLEAIRNVSANENVCYQLSSEGLKPLRVESEITGRVISLYPTTEAPILVIAGFPMHRMKNIMPTEAAKLMVKAISKGRIAGRVLDTATGLGYTAVLASQKAEEVITIELDNAAQRLAALNPWSRKLFERENVKRIIGDSFELIKSFESEYFDAVIHDPPTMSLAGDLYSGQFYEQIYRVLKRRGELFHYSGDPESSSIKRLNPGIVKRLEKAGFSRINVIRRAYGVKAVKQR